MNESRGFQWQYMREGYELSLLIDLLKSSRDSALPWKGTSGYQ